MQAEHKIVNNEKQAHFEIHEGDETAYLEYRFYNEAIAFMHTEVPQSMEGRGVATALVGYAFTYAKDYKKQVIVYCPFVLTYVKRHPEVHYLLDQAHKH